jgi:hypothetical protein
MFPCVTGSVCKKGEFVGLENYGWACLFTLTMCVLSIYGNKWALSFHKKRFDS